MTSAGSLDWFFADLRIAARALRKNPGFSAIALSTLALGIGANTAIFSVVDTVILRPLTYPDADRLVTIHEMVPSFSKLASLIPVNAMHFLEWRKKTHSFDQLALLGGITVNLTGAGEPERVPAARVTPNLFPMLGMQTQIGRTFLEEEDKPGRERVVVLNHELWIRRFGADPGVIGRKIMLDGNPYEIVGVLRPGIHFPKMSQLYAMTLAEERPQLWRPFALRDDEMDEMGDFDYACIARLRRGVTAARAVSELNVVQADFVKRVPFKVDLYAALVPLQDQITGRSRTGLELLLAAVGVVLLIGCVNIANLLLGRAIGRRREFAIRTALGAGSFRVVRQVMVESLVLSAMGGLLGVAIAFAAIRGVVAYAPVDLPRLDEVHLDARIFAFTLAVSVLTGLACGLLPAWRSARADPQDAMKSGARGATAGLGSSRLRALLVSIETGLSGVCLIAGGLLLHSFVNLLQVDRGFEAERVVAVDLSLPASHYPTSEKRSAFLQTVIERVQSLAGVQSAGISNKLPLSGEGGNNLIAVEGRNVPVGERPLADIRRVNRDYFRTMGIPIYRGRVFDDSDRVHGVALVSAVTAAGIWPGEDVMGKRVRVGGDDSPLLEIAGVVGDVRGVSLSRNPSFTVYVPYWQRSFGDVSLAVKTAMDPVGISAAIRATIRQIDPELPVPAFRTMQQIVAESVAQPRFQVRLVLLFAVIATLLASLGIYGVVSYSVAQRTSEMGIRLALGAPPGGIVRMVLGQGLVPVATGLAGGVAASIALGRVLRGLLFGVQAADPITICAAVAVLASVALAAACIPAFRATRVDPVNSLRYE